MDPVRKLQDRERQRIAEETVRNAEIARGTIARYEATLARYINALEKREFDDCFLAIWNEIPYAAIRIFKFNDGSADGAVLYLLFDNQSDSLVVKRSWVNVPVIDRDGDAIDGEIYTPTETMGTSDNRDLSNNVAYMEAFIKNS